MLPPTPVPIPSAPENHAANMPPPLRASAVESAATKVGFWANQWPLMFITLMVGLSVTVWLILVQEKLYRGRVRMEVHQSAIPADPKMGPGIAAELEIIDSQALPEMVKSMGLAKRWNLADDTDALAKLKPMVQVQQERRTNIICMDVFSPKPFEAPSLANGLATAYAKVRNAKAKNTSSIERAELDAERKQQEARLEEAWAKILAFMKTHPLLDAGSADPSGMPKADAAKSLRELQIEASIKRLKAQVDWLDKWTTLEDGLSRLDAVGYDPAVMKSLRAGGRFVIQQDRDFHAALEQATANLRQKITENQTALDAASEQPLTEEEQKDEDAYRTIADEYFKQRNLAERLLERAVDVTMPSMPLKWLENAHPSAEVFRPKTMKLAGMGAATSVLLGLALGLMRAGRQVV
jgi:hypothetical protein